LAYIQKGGIHARQNIFYSSLINVAQHARVALDIQIEKPSVTHFRDTDFGGFDIDEEQTLTHGRGG
jgi:hypothetical protein